MSLGTDLQEKRIIVSKEKRVILSFIKIISLICLNDDKGTIIKRIKLEIRI